MWSKLAWLHCTSSVVFRSFLLKWPHASSVANESASLPSLSAAAAAAIQVLNSAQVSHKLALLVDNHDKSSLVLLTLCCCCFVHTGPQRCPSQPLQHRSAPKQQHPPARLRAGRHQSLSIRLPLCLLQHTHHTSTMRFQRQLPSPRLFRRSLQHPANGPRQCNRLHNNSLPRGIPSAGSSNRRRPSELSDNALSMLRCGRQLRVCPVQGRTCSKRRLADGSA
jgi:hypothetical protein